MALDMAAWSLDTELIGSNIAVHVVHPGATATKFFKKAGIPNISTDGFAKPLDVASKIFHDIAHSADLSTFYGSRSEQVYFRTNQDVCHTPTG